MGIDARTQGEQGDLIEELLDPKSLVKKILPEYDSEKSVCLRFVDPYGETIFNQVQIPVLLAELETAVRSCQDTETRVHGEKLISLVASTVDEVHTYVRFIGD